MLRSGEGVPESWRVLSILQMGFRQRRRLRLAGQLPLRLRGRQGAARGKNTISRMIGSEGQSRAFRSFIFYEPHLIPKGGGFTGVEFFSNPVDAESGFFLNSKAMLVFSGCVFAQAFSTAKVVPSLSMCA